MSSSNSAVSVCADVLSGALDHSKIGKHAAHTSQRPAMKLVSSQCATTRTPVSREEALRQAILRTG